MTLTAPTADELDLVSPFGAPCQVRSQRGAPVPRLTKYIPRPHPVQNVFLQMRARSVFYGGAAGGAKSSGLLMGGLQFVDVPGYAALLLRRTYGDLNLQGGLMPNAARWLDGSDAKWSAQEHTWFFPGPDGRIGNGRGGSLTFGYAANYDQIVRRYKGSEWTYIGFDESTQHEERSVTFMFTRLRKAVIDAPPTHDGLTLADIPYRMRPASNPGEIGHAWHKREYVDAVTRPPGTWFLPSYLEDNPSIEPIEYTANLKKEHPVNWRRYRYGDWEARDPSQIFDISRFDVLETPWPQARDIERCRFWDMASTEPEKGKDPDETVGTLYAWNRGSGEFAVEDVVALRGEPDKVERVLEQTAKLDGRHIPVVIEQEPGSEGKAYISHIQRHVLPGFGVHAEPASGAKELRIRALVPTANIGLVKIVKGLWNGPWLKQIDAYPLVDHDDQADSWAGAHKWITGPRSSIIV